MTVMDKIRQKTRSRCKMLVISAATNLEQYTRIFCRGAAEFILKDISAPEKTCRFIESLCRQLKGGRKIY